MRFLFEITDTECLSSIRDEQSFLDGIFKCKGKSTILFRDLAIEDSLEVIFRIAECLAVLDTLVEKAEIYSEKIMFTFQFENRLYFMRDNASIKVFDRENNSIEIDSLTFEQIVIQRDAIISFITNTVQPVAPYLAGKLLNRDVL